MSARRRGLVVATLLVMAPTLAFGHPHHHIDQQAQLNVSSEAVEIVLRIVPSIDDGAAMFDIVDLDRDGAVSPAEAGAFGAEVLRTVDLRWGGRTLELGDASVTVPSREVVAQGRGVIQVRAALDLDVLEQAGQPLELDVAYRRFDPIWFVQPFVSRDLSDAISGVQIDRTNGARVVVRLQ